MIRINTKIKQYSGLGGIFSLQMGHAVGLYFA